MNFKVLVISCSMLVTTSIFGQEPTAVKKFWLYPFTKSCVCIKAKKETKTVISTEVRVGNLAHQVVYQVFWTRTDPKRELFRIEVGDYSNGKGAQLWNYGIANEGDFNGDGLPDYSWYGGDDTAVRMYLFLSSSTGYKRVDLMKTVEASWRQRFHKPAPDLSDNGSGYGFSEAVLERSPTGLILHANIHYANLDETKKATYRFDIVEADFKP